MRCNEQAAWTGGSLASSTADAARATASIRSARAAGGSPAIASGARSLGHYHVLAPAHGVTRIRGLGTAPAAGSRALASPHAARSQADEHFRVAALLVDRGRAREAALEAQKALRLCEPRPEQQAFYAWILYERSGLGGPVPAAVWDHLEHARQADPHCERAIYYRDLLAHYCGCHVRWKPDCKPDPDERQTPSLR
jgi:hypothetical protein